MELAVAYRNRSRIIAADGHQQVTLQPNLKRDAVAFNAPLFYTPCVSAKPFPPCMISLSAICVIRNAIKAVTKNGKRTSERWNRCSIERHTGRK